MAYREAWDYIIQDHLKGMSIQYVGSNKIEVQTGSIEIDGDIYSQSSPEEVMLAENLRSGESESSSTIYYLYAIAGSSLTFKFSTTEPTKDRFGNTVSSVDDTDPSQGWYHPTEGVTWRWIGQVYNNSSSNILEFTKSTPGEFIGSWTSFGTGTTSKLHGLGAIPKVITALFSTSSNGSSPVNTLGWSWSGSSQFGCRLGHNGSITDSSIPVLMGNNGVFHDGTSWRTSGYMQLILKR